MHPSRRGIKSTTFGPNRVRSLLPPTVVDSVLGALPFGNHCELARFSQFKWRRAVAANNHVVVDLQDMGWAKPLCNITTDKHLLPKRMAWLQRTVNPMQLGVPSFSSSLDTLSHRRYRTARWQIQNCDD
jgi:hypothetical protein